jgi:CRP-like cAMP-binding protein
MTDEQDPLRERLSLLFPINNLPPNSQDKILQTAEAIEFRKKEYVFLQGGRDNYSFYVLDGVVELYADDQLIKTVEGGEAASFHALAQLQPRQMSARAKSRVNVLRVDRQLLDKLLSMESNAGLSQPAADIEVAEIDESGPTDWLTAILQSELFARIPPSNIQRMLETLESIEFKAGDVIVQQGGPGDYYYAVQTGKCAVTRRAANNKELKLAELGPGDTFGEEALVSNAKRNASVTMLTDGELARLTKQDFLDLITKPILDTVSFGAAQALVEQGAIWLDVRFPEEHKANGLEGSINIPASFLRNRCDELSPDTPYVVYCDTGGRSSAAAFLLAQRGFDVSYVEGGAIMEVPQRPPKEALPEPVEPADKEPTEPVAKQPAVAVEPPPTGPSEAMIEADSRAQSLAADLEKAKLQIAQAQRLMEQAEATKREAERIVQEKLKAEREKLDREAEKVQASLEEAQRLKGEIEAEQRTAAEEAARYHREEEERTLARQREAEDRLQQEERRLEEVYRKQEQELEQLEEAQTRSKEELEQAWKALEVESTQTRERLEAAKRLELDLQEKECQQLAQIEEAEQEIRQRMKHELETERHKLEAQFAQTAEEVERAQRERAAADNARRAAEEEAKKIVEEYKAQQERLIAKYETQIAVERKKLESDAERIRAEMELATRAKDEAEAAKREADRQLELARLKQPAVEPGAVGIEAEIETIERRVEAAALQLREAIAAEMTAEDRQRENEKRLERTYDSKTEINMLMQKELEEWVADQERIQSSTGQRTILEKQRAQTDRIKTYASKARQDTASHDKALLDEIAEQLGG